MKYLTIILLLLFSLNLSGQNYNSVEFYKPNKPQWIEPVKIIGLYSASILLEAVGDAKYDDGQMALGRGLSAASTGLLIMIPFISKTEKSRWGWYLATVSGALLLNQIGDGFNQEGEKTLGHALSAISTGLLVVAPSILSANKDRWVWKLISYTNFRIAYFDFTYNMTRGFPIEQIGSVSMTDKMLYKLNPPETKFGRSICFFLAIDIPFSKLRDTY